MDKHIQMANYFNRIGDLINRPEVDRRGLRDLLWQIQREPVRNIHPVTKEIWEQVIYYITEVADDDESETYNENMDFLSETLEEVPKIILSESTHKKVDLLNLYIDKERRTEQEPQHNNLINIIRKIIQAAINLLFKNTRASTHTHRIFPEGEEDQEVPIKKGTNRRRGQLPPLITLKPSKKTQVIPKQDHHVKSNCQKMKEDKGKILPHSSFKTTTTHTT